MTVTTYDADLLDRLGKRRAELRTELEAVNAGIDAQIAAGAAAGVQQAELMRRSGLARESVAQKMLPPEQRWKRGTRD